MPDARLAVNLLGPVEAVADDGSIKLGGPKQRGVLALLALTPGETVSIERLVEGVWGDAAPDAARRSLQVYVSNLRRSLGADVITTTASGYALAIDPEQVDHRRFRRLMGEAGEARDPQEGARQLSDALALVRGEPLSDVLDLPFAPAARTGLEREVLAATERQLELRLEIGEDRQLIRELEELVAVHPLRESLRGLLMLACYRAGRQAAALTAYEEARRTLAEELGIDPSPQLQELHERILRQDPALQTTPSSHPTDATEDRSRLEPSGRGTDELSSRELVGREGEIGQLREALEAARAGRPQVVLLGGEAGIGKSRLLAALMDGAAGRGFEVLFGHCIDLGDSALPFAPITEALRSFVRRADPTTLEALVGPSLPELSRIVPDLGDARASVGDRATATTSEGRAHLFAAVLDLFERLAGEQPVLVGVEDIHWADRSTLDLLDYIARNLRTERLLFVASFRTDELHRRHPLRRPLAELGRLRQVRRIDLAPFGAEEVGAQLERILGREPAPALVGAITERSGGNPFYVEELLASMGGTVASDGAELLPPALHDVVAGRIGQLGDETRRVLAVAAVAGERIDHRLLEVVDRPGGTELVTALREAVDHGVLLTDGEGYRFRHALVREVVYEDLLPGERNSLHRAIADALEAEPSAAPGGQETVHAQVAHHAYIAHDSTRALRASLRAAADATRAAAYAEAQQNYERALELWDEAGASIEDRTRADVMEAAADVAHLAGDARRAVALMREVIDGAPNDVDPTLRGLRYARLGEYQALIGPDDETLAAWDRAVELVPELPPTTARANVLAKWARGRREFEPERAIAAAEESIAISREIGDDVDISALIMLGASTAGVGQVDEAVELLREAGDLAEQRADRREIANYYTALSAVLIKAGRANEGADVSLEGLERIRALGVERLYWGALAGNATSGLFLAGRWEEAASFLDELGDRTTALDWLLLLQARLQAFRGDIGPARETLARAVEHRAHENFRYPAIRIALELFARDLDAAHGFVLEHTRDEMTAHAGTVNQLRAISLQVEADRLRDPDTPVDAAELRELADELLAGTTDELSGGIGHAEPWRLTAVAEHTRFGAAPSPEAWRAALAAWEELDWPYQVAYTSYRLAEAELAVGVDREQVGPALGRAAEIAGRLGARPLLADIEALADRAS